jgi:alginate O-acetyltransferase complex protein AlgJ
VPRYGGKVRWTMVQPEREKVLRGKAGWLFLRQDTNDVLGQHTGRVALGEDGQRAWRRVLRGRVSRAASLNFSWLCQITPDKESVYPEHLPAEVVPASRRPVHEVLQIARSLGAPVTYPLEELSSWKERGLIYSRTDTHWNQFGAYAAYRALCKQLARGSVQVSAVEEAAIEWVPREVAGDLGSKLEPPVRAPTLRAELAQHRSRLVFDNGVKNHGRVMIFEQEAPGKPSAVVFGESFTHQLLVFLKESFRRLVFAHTSMMISELILHEKPDVVINVPLERFVIRVPSDDDAHRRFRETVKRKIASRDTSQNVFVYLGECPSPDAALLQRQEGVIPWEIERRNDASEISVYVD